MFTKNSQSMWHLVPQPGIKPGPFALGAQSFSHWTTREVPNALLLVLSLAPNWFWPWRKACPWHKQGCASWPFPSPWALSVFIQKAIDCPEGKRLSRALDASEKLLTSTAPFLNSWSTGLPVPDDSACCYILSPKSSCECVCGRGFVLVVLFCLGGLGLYPPSRWQVPRGPRPTLYFGVPRT